MGNPHSEQAQNNFAKKPTRYVCFIMSPLICRFRAVIAELSLLNVTGSTHRVTILLNTEHLII